MHQNSKTAVLVFSESVDQQARSKIVQTDAHTNYRLLQRFTKRSLQAAKNTGFDVVQFDESLQKGNSFAKRITYATQEVFARGYDRVIVIGGDCPDLKEQDILNISIQLQSAEMVLGPDLRGGVYAIGLNRDYFNSQSFKGLMWQTSSLRKSFVQYAKRLSGSIYWLKSKADFNAKDDITEYWNVSASLRSIIAQLKESLFYIINPPQSSPIRILVSDFDRRGP